MVWKRIRLPFSAREGIKRFLDQSLEILGLVLNPFTRTLQPMKLMVAKH